MFNWLWNADTGLMLGALGSITGIASLIYARSQAHGAHAQAEGVRQQAIEALRAAELVAEGVRQQALEALRAAGLVAESARQQAVEALRAAGLVAESARQQAVEARWRGSTASILGVSNSSGARFPVAPSLFAPSSQPSGSPHDPHPWILGPSGTRPAREIPG